MFRERAATEAENGSGTMENISVFDIIGPIMVGPSSSHTAGALRIALVAHKIFKEKIQEVVFTLYGSFEKTYKGHGTDRALLGGIMGFQTYDERIRDAYSIADERGIRYSFVLGTMDIGMHPNTVKIEVKGNGKSLNLVGESVGGGSILIREINGIKVKFTGEYTSIIIEQKDMPGIVAHITGCLTKRNINIAFMSMFREAIGQRAFTILELDENVSEEVLEDIKENQHIEDAFLVSFR